MGILGIEMNPTIRLTIQPSSGARLYVLEGRSNLLFGAWQILTNHAGTNGKLSLDAMEPYRFYRFKVGVGN